MGGRGGSGRVDANQKAFDLAVQEMAKAELARRSAVAAAKAVAPKEVQAPRAAIDALEALTARIQGGQIGGARNEADAILAKVRGRELKALASHYGTIINRSETAARTRAAIRESAIGRLSDFMAIQRTVSQRR